MKDREQSEFNMAVSYLNRLNALLYICNESSMNIDAYTWYHSLVALFRELSTSMKEPEIKEFDDKADTIHELVNKNITSNSQRGTSEMGYELYKALHNFELKLRKVLQDSGLQNKLADDPRTSMR